MKLKIRCQKCSEINNFVVQGEENPDKIFLQVFSRGCPSCGKRLFTPQSDKAFQELKKLYKQKSYEQARCG